MNPTPPNLAIPYPGLRPFDEADHLLFFGRNEQANELLMRLEDSAFVAVVGSSGSGKSSLVRAGLLPLLRNGFLFGTDDWKIAVVRPGHEPYQRLARKLAAFREDIPQDDVLTWLRRSDDGLLQAVNQLCSNHKTHVLVVIDQFEELFGFRRAGDSARSLQNCASRDEASAFVAMLLAAVRMVEQRLRVMITMRSDFVGDCEVFLGLPQAVSQSQFLVPRLTRSQMEAAITGPSQIRQAGFEPYDFQPGLVNTLINEAGDRPDQLPLLQHVLMRTWKESDRKRLTEADYTQAGRIEKALSNDADAAWQQLDTDGRRLAQQMFLLLCDVSLEGQITRRRPLAQEVMDVARADCAQIERVVRVFQAEDRNFLLPPSPQPIEPSTVLDISHESLLRQWSRFQIWVGLEARSAQQYRRLRDEVENRTRFLTDTHLEQAQEWLDLARPNPFWAMRYDGAESADKSPYQSCVALINRSEQERQRRLQAERDEVEREQARVLREAEAKEEIRRAREAEAAARREQALQTEKADVEAQRAREAEAAKVRYRRMTRLALVACVAAVVFLGFALKKWWDANAATVQAKQQQADTTRQNAGHFWRFAILARDTKEPDPLKAAYLFLRGAEKLASIVHGQKSVADTNGIVMDGLAASAVNRPFVRSWVHVEAVRGAQFSRDESLVLTWSGGEARLWDMTKSEPLQTFKHEGPVNGAQFSQDASRVLTWSADKTARLWDMTKAEPRQTFKHESPVNGAQFSQDASRVLTWSGGEARLWDVTKAEPLQTFKHESPVNGAQFSQDASRVLTWSGDFGSNKGEAWLWDVTKSESRLTFKHEGPVNGAQFSQDASRVLTWSADKTARLWDVTKSELLQTFKHEGPVDGAQFSRDESRVLTWSGDFDSNKGEVRLWDVTKSEPRQTFKHESPVKGAQFSRDESRVLTWSGAAFASNKGEARLWDVTKSEPLQTFKHEGPVNGAQFSRDEVRVLTWSADKTARLWDVTKAELLQTFKHEGPVNGAQFSQDASRVLTWSADKTARLWDMTKAEPRQTFKHESPVNGAQFSQDASRVLTWSGGEARLWDVTKAEPLQTFKHEDSVYGAQFSQDASRVLTWSADFGSNKGEARLWDVTKSEPRLTFKHEGPVDGAQFSQDASRVLTWSADFGSNKGEARLWDVTKSEPRLTFKHEGPVKGAQFGQDASRVLTWSGGEARLWDVTKAEPLQTFKHEGPVKGAQFSQDASRVLTWSGGEARLWDMTKAEPRQTFKHEGPVKGAQFGQDASRVLTWSGGEARLWDVTKSEPLQTFKHEGPVYGAQFSRDEVRVLTWSADKTARLWDVTKAEPLQTFKHEGPVDGAQFSRDASRVLTWSATAFTSNKGEARLWDSADPLAALTPAERILELEVRSGATLDEQLNLRTLKFGEWQAKVQSSGYQKIQGQLPTRKTGQGQ